VVRNLKRRSPGEGAAFDSLEGRVDTLLRTYQTMQRDHNMTSGAGAEEYAISGLKVISCLLKFLLDDAAIRYGF